jgi:hypothetical protein
MDPRAREKLAGRLVREITRPAHAPKPRAGPAPWRLLFVFVRARPDTIVSRLAVHRSSRNAFDLANYVVKDGQLFGARGKRIGNRFVSSHFKIISVLMSQY